MNQISVWVKNPRNDLYTPVQIVAVPRIGESIILAETTDKLIHLEVIEVVYTALGKEVRGEPTVDIYTKEVKKRSKLKVVRGRKQ